MEVAVIVACRAPAPWLGETLDAILAQERPVREIVLVDDGSDPPLAPAPRHTGRVRLVVRAESGGPALARQAGLDGLGDAEWIALCDADDVWRPERLTFGAAQLTDVDVLSGGAEVVGPDGAPLRERADPPRLAPDPAPWLFEHGLVTSATLVRRSVLDPAGGFAGRGLRRAEDVDLWLRLLARGARFATDPRIVVAYRRHPDGLTADVTALARAFLEVRGTHAHLVEPHTAQRLRAHDLRTLARGHVRSRDYAAARSALIEAATLAPPPARDRALQVLLRVPGVREGLGRRDPYRRRP